MFLNNRQYSHKPQKAQRSTTNDKYQKKNEDIPVSKSNIRSDVLGSYTGTPENRNEAPVQDADDL